MLVTALAAVVHTLPLASSFPPSFFFSCCCPAPLTPIPTPFFLETNNAALKEIDLDSNSKVSFIEYLLFNYKKTLTQLFEEKPGNLADLIAKLEAAIDLHEEVQERRRSDDAKMKELEEASGGTGVKAQKAKMELEGMRARSHTGQNMAEVRAAFKKRQAEKALAKGDPMAEEMERLKLEQKEAEDDLKAKQEASRQRLKDRAAAFAEGK